MPKDANTISDSVVILGGTLDPKLANIDKSELELFVREDKIYDEEFKSEPISYGRDVWRRFKRSKVTVTATVIILFIIIMAAIGPNLSGYPYLDQLNEFKSLPPRIPVIENLGIFDGSREANIQETSLENYKDSFIAEVGRYEQKTRSGSVQMLRIKYNAYKQIGAEEHYFWLGSDHLGRDLFSRLWQGTRVSLMMAFMVVGICLTIGVTVGSICGYYGGWIDLIIQRVMDIIWNIPSLPLNILLIMRFGTGLLPLTMVFCLTGWMGMANNVRIQFYRYKNMEYVLASRTMGARDRRVMFKYILPNAIGTMITSMALTVPNVIFQEAGLSYLGLGIQAPEPSIGQLLSSGQAGLLEYPYMILFPGIVIVLLMLAFNLFGNGLRDAFNPALRK